MSVTVYHYPRCSTCKKAIKYLAERGVAMKLVDLVETPPSTATLKKVLKASGLPVTKLWNTSGELYRAGGYSTKSKTMSEAETLETLASEGKLIKRPLVLGSDFALIGFRETEYEKHF